MSASGSPRRRALACLGLWLAVAPFGAPAPAAAQTILNTERFQLSEVTGFHASADLALSLQRGNTRVLDISSSGMVGTLRARHWPRIIFGGKYLSSDERSILDQQFLQLRYSYILSPRTQTFHFVQAQKNETLLLRSRWLLGTGLRQELIGGERTSFAVGTGVMGEWERLDPERLDPGEPVSQEAVRMANLAVLSHELEGGARILNIVYLQPRLGRPSDLRLLNDLGLLVPITNRIRSTVSLEWRRDTRPPSPLGRDDLTLKAGFAIEFQ